MPEKLPKGWVKTTLGEIAEPSRERALPMEFPGLRYVGLEHIEPHSMRLLEHGGAREARSSSVRFAEGDVLYGKMRPYLNKVWVAEFDGLCSAEFLVFRKSAGLNSQFLALRLNSEDFVKFANVQVSGERPRVSFENLSRFPILLPPTAEQERILGKLSASFSRVGRAETAARRARERLQRYRFAVLKAAVSGELTRETREMRLKTQDFETGEAVLRRLLAARRASWEGAELNRLRAAGNEPKSDEWKSRYREPVSLGALNLSEAHRGWIWVSIDQVASGEPGAIQSGPFGSQLLHSEFVAEGILAIGIDNILDGVFSLGRQHRITASKYEGLRKFTARPLDVVVTVMATVGRVCVLPQNLEPAIITKHCYRITPARDWVDSSYLSLALRADAPTRQHIFGNIRGQTRPGINGTILKAAPVPLPPIAEQLEIVREVERRLSAADRLAAALEQQRAFAPVTRQALLRDAFAGRLVPQDANDEPGSVLLERTRAAREAESKKPKGIRMPRLNSTKRSPIRRPLLAVLKENSGLMTPEELFHASGHTQDSVDRFFAELRELTATPPKIEEERGAGKLRRLRALR